MSTEPSDTKKRILDAAELLFADHGFAATSMRSITAEAGVNLAAANYHFGSKEALFEAVLSRRMGPLNDERLGLLDAIENGDGELDLERIVTAFIGPALRVKHNDARGGAVFVRLIGHAISEPNPAIRKLFTKQFGEIFTRFSAALRQALPALPEEDIVWRFLFMVGAMAHTMAMSSDFNRLTSGRCGPTDAETLIRRLVPFVTAGLRGPATRLEAGGD